MQPQMHARTSVRVTTTLGSVPKFLSRDDTTGLSLGHTVEVKLLPCVATRSDLPVSRAGGGKQVRKPGI